MNYLQEAIDDVSSSQYIAGYSSKLNVHLPTFFTVISYDYPLNERIRTLLRLEDLFAKEAYFSEKASAADHHAALSVMFDIMEVASRADLKLP